MNKLEEIIDNVTPGENLEKRRQRYEDTAAKLKKISPTWLRWTKDSPKFVPEFVCKKMRRRVGKRAWKLFRFFVDDKAEVNNTAWSVKMLVDLKNRLEVFDAANLGLLQALEAKTYTMPSEDALRAVLPPGEKLFGNDDIWTLIFRVWPVLATLE